MHRRIILAGLLLALAVPVWAQSGEGRQIVSFNLGGFAPQGIGGRSPRDVILDDVQFLTVETEDLRNATVGADFLVGVGDFLEVGLGVNYYARTVPTVFRDWTDEYGNDIAQRLHLRIVPLTATLRFLPLSNRAPVQPYIGAGVAVMFWRYREVGDFLDWDNYIFNGDGTASGTSFGPVILGGVRAPLGDRLLIGGEIRWQKAEGEVKPDIVNDYYFSNDRIGLGGMTYQFTLGVRF